MTDQHRADTLGAYGNERAATPVLDELASSGTRFDRWYTPTAICTPARASLLTGQARSGTSCSPTTNATSATSRTSPTGSSRSRVPCGSRATTAA
ncbi:sulfatase-like hydrolase/transferase [Actinomadura sp. CNU-125]|uniref:sulfatase-like hydrolase/transferase n=1 Tax=Actinomadura sp. CNU-125 TaxID=1904961 RepID=UPI003966FDE9